MPTPASGTHAFVPTEPSHFAGTFHAAIDINDAGQIVGRSNTDTGDALAVLWESGSMTDLGGLGGSYSIAIRVNETEQIVGLSDTPTGGTHAVLWEAGSVVDLHPIGSLFSVALGINDPGQIVGLSDSDTGETLGSYGTADQSSISATSEAPIAKHGPSTTPLK